MTKPKKLSERTHREKAFFDFEAENNIIPWAWRGKTGQFRHNLRGEFVKSRLELKEGVKVLELGSGLGGLTERLISSKATIYAVDISSKSLAQAKKKNKSKNVKFFLEDVHAMSFKSNTFDCVLGNGILHHVDHKVVLTESLRVLKPGGTILFFEPNLLNPQVFLERTIPLFRKMSQSSPDEMAFVRWKLEKDLEKAGFVNIEVIPYGFVYPAFSYSFAKFFKRISDLLEKTPLIKELSGSIIAIGRKPKVP